MDTLAKELDLKQPYNSQGAPPEPGSVGKVHSRKTSTTGNVSKAKKDKSNVPPVSLSVAEQIKWIQMEISKHRHDELRAKHAASLLEERAKTLSKKSTAILRAKKEVRNVVGAQTEMYL